MPYPLADMLLYFFLYSFFGWVMETVLCSVKERRFVNRGFLNGPVCPIYGCGVLLMLLALVPVRNGIPHPLAALPVVYVLGTVLASAVEYVTSWAMEKLFHARWWDYSHFRFNLNGRICLSISLIWGALATGFLYLVQPLLERLVVWLYGCAGWLPGLLAGVFALVFVVDLAVSVRVARAIGNKLEQLEKWSELIRAHLESLELPSKQAVLERLEAAYARYTEHSARRGQEWRERLAEWRALPEEDFRRRLADTAAELKKRREGAIAGTRALQRRMLRAFPHLSRRGKAAARDPFENEERLQAKTDTPVPGGSRDSVAEPAEKKELDACGKRP